MDGLNGQSEGRGVGDGVLSGSIIKPKEIVDKIRNCLSSGNRCKYLILCVDVYSNNRSGYMERSVFLGEKDVDGLYSCLFGLSLSHSIFDVNSVLMFVDNVNADTVEKHLMSGIALCVEESADGTTNITTDVISESAHVLLNVA